MSLMRRRLELTPPAGGALPAEPDQRRELAAEGIHTFATPTREAAQNRDFYGWMRNGAELYSHIERRYQLFDGSNAASGQVCFETFPHAVACAIAGKIVAAKQKRIVRPELCEMRGSTRRDPPTST